MSHGVSAGGPAQEIASAPGSAILEIDNLRTHFFTQAGVVRAVDGVSYTLRGMSFLLHRIGYSPQVPVHRAVERDEAAVAEWRAVTWAKARG